MKSPRKRKAKPSQPRSHASSPSVHTWNGNDFSCADTDGTPSVHTFVKSLARSSKVPRSSRENSNSCKQPPTHSCQDASSASAPPQQNSALPCQGPTSVTSGVSSRKAQNSAAVSKQGTAPLLPAAASRANKQFSMVHRWNFLVNLVNPLCGNAGCAVKLSLAPIPNN